MKLFPNFMSIPFDLPINIMGDELHKQSLIFDMFIMFIQDHIDRKLHSLKCLELKFGLSSEFFDKIPVRILLDVFFRVQVF